jgi:uncharacterized protein YacL
MSMANLETFYYDNKIVRNFAIATIIWGIVGMLVGLIAAFQLIYPVLNLGIAEITYGRIRPLHTNAAIFAFVGNGIYMGVYYSLQRLLKARMFSNFLSQFHFWGWQLIIVAAAITLPMGYTSSKEYAELEWPIDIAIALIWVVFGINMIMTIVKRRERLLKENQEKLKTALDERTKEVVEQKELIEAKNKDITDTLLGISQNLLTTPSRPSPNAPQMFNCQTRKFGGFDQIQCF